MLLRIFHRVGSRLRGVLHRDWARDFVGQPGNVVLVVQRGHDVLLMLTIFGDWLLEAVN